MTAPVSKVFVPVHPIPASRPKVSKYGTYYTKTYAEWRKVAGKWIEANFQLDPVETPLVVFLESIATKPRTSRLVYPRADVDNYAKAALDILNEQAWRDDDLIIKLTTAKRFAEPKEPPGSRVVWRVATPYEIQHQRAFGEFAEAQALASMTPT